MEFTVCSNSVFSERFG